jgi:hypothetical protein
VLFSEELDAVDEVFVEDAHESPRLLVSVADFLAQRLHDALVARAYVCPHCRKLASHFVPELDDLHFESRYARGQLLEELDSPFQHLVLKNDDDTIVFALTATPISTERSAINLAAAQVYLSDAPGVVDVVERVGVEDDEIGALAGSDGAELIELERLG